MASRYWCFHSLFVPHLLTLAIHYIDPYGHVALEDALKICPGPKLCPKPPCRHDGQDPDHWNCKDENSDSSSSISSSTSSTTTKSSGGGGDDDDDDDDDYFTNDSSGRDMTGTGWSQENVGNRRFNAVAYIAMAMVVVLFLAAMAAYRKKVSDASER